jgi:hypothetical protein
MQWPARLINHPHRPFACHAWIQGLHGVNSPAGSSYRELILTDGLTVIDPDVFNGTPLEITKVSKEKDFLLSRIDSNDLVDWLTIIDSSSELGTGNTGIIWYGCDLGSQH